MTLTAEYQAAKDRLHSMTRGANFLILGLSVSTKKEEFGFACMDVHVESVSGGTIGGTLRLSDPSRYVGLDAALEWVEEFCFVIALVTDHFVLLRRAK